MNSCQNSINEALNTSVLSSNPDLDLEQNQNTLAYCNEIDLSTVSISFHSQHIPSGTSQTSNWDRLTCLLCHKKFERRDKLKRHMLGVHKQGIPGDPFPCEYCDESYLQKNLLEAHYKAKHQVKGNDSIMNRSKSTAVQLSDKGRIKCMECNIKYSSLKKLRAHLRIGHQMDMTEEKISFPNMNAFLKWKLDIERKESTFFFNGRGPLKGPDYLQRIYLCNRSGTLKVHAGNRKEKRRMNNLIGSQKTGIICTAAMRVMIYGNKVEVEYCLQHYGHGRDLNFIQLTEEEQAAVLENASSGIPLEEQLNDIKHTKSLSEHFKAWTVKKRDSRFINSAFTSENYNVGVNVTKSVEQWVRVCSNMEESPVLLYTQEEVKNKLDFLLIIMTEFQKHVLMVSAKQVVCLDTFCQFNKGRHFFTVLMVMDEQEVAFPVAFCFSKQMNKSIMMQFLSSIKESTGALSCSYFMSNDNQISYDAWQEIMDDKPTWVWSIWSFEDNVRKYMNSLLKDIPTREATYRLLRTIMECNSQPVFATMLKNFKKSLLDNEKSKSFGKSFEKHFGSNTEKWACCYRKDLKLSTVIYLEFLHKTLKNFFRKSFTRRLDTFLFVLMKWLRYKMLDRLCIMLDEEKTALAKASISAFHEMGLEIECQSIISLSGQIWLIQSENDGDVYVTREFESCPELCDLRCLDCKICVHMYSCSCVQSLINANICQHIHAVVWKFLTPYFSPPVSPVQDTFNDTCDDPPISNVPENIFGNLESVCKQLEINKNKLTKKDLSKIRRMLNKCHQVCSNNEIPDSLSSKSTQTEHITVLSSNHVLDRLPNMSDLTSENVSSMPVTPILNYVSHFAPEENENILESNNTSASESIHTNQRHCSKKRKVQGMSILEDFPQKNLFPTTKASVMTTNISANAQLNCDSETPHKKSDSVFISPLCTNTYTTSSPVPNKNISNFQAVVSPLLSEKPFLVKCNAPIIRKSKHHLKTICVESNDRKKGTNSKNVEAPIPSILTNNPSNSSELFWDSASERYFVIKDNLPLTSKLDPTEIQSNPGSESPFASSSSEDDSSTSNEEFEKLFTSDSSFTLEDSVASKSSPNNPPQFVSHHPIIVRASIASKSSPNDFQKIASSVINDMSD